VDQIPLTTLYAVLVVLLLVSAFFSISETSMMALNRYRLRYLDRSGHRGARLTMRLLEAVDRLLGVVLLGNNLINAGVALLVGEIARRFLGGSEIALFAATAISAFAILVFSEITPKVIGATYPDRIAIAASYVLTPLLKVLQPVVWFINLFVRSLLWLMRLTPAPATETKFTPEELRTLVLEAGNYIPKKHQSILLNLFELEKITVDDIMTPRNQIEAIDSGAPPAILRQQIATAHHRRLAVYEREPDNIIGVIALRQLLNVASPEIDAEQLLQFMREPYFVPSGTPLFTQLQEFQEAGHRLCFVVDEYGELNGLLTLEDIVEELIGEFATRSPLQPRQFHAQADGSYLVEGGSLLRELNRKLGFHFPLDGPKTLNGLILEHLQAMPEPGTSLKVAGHALEIVQTMDRAVKAVRLAPSGAASPPGRRPNQPAA
jgi:Mg2+/Co2+ transporter CorB